MKTDQLIEYNVIFFFIKHAENEVRTLVPHLIFLIKSFT